jgi:hypothetical protein
MCIGIGIVKAPRDGDVLVKTVRQEVCFPHHHKTREDDDRATPTRREDGTTYLFFVLNV